MPSAAVVAPTSSAIAIDGAISNNNCAESSNDDSIHGASSSVENIHTLDCYTPGKPKSVPTLVDADEPLDTLPFTLLPGEFLLFVGPVHKGDCIYVSTFRLFVLLEDKRGFCNIPLMTVDTIEVRDMFLLQINCKDGRVFKVSADNNELSLAWFKVLTQCTTAPRKLDDLFAFKVNIFARGHSSIKGRVVVASPFTSTSSPISRAAPIDCTNESCTSFADAHRLGFIDQYWRISNANYKYALCETYPRQLLVPAAISDDDLKRSSDGRFLRRLPVAVWRSREHGSVLLRSSQPRVGLFSWRNAQDEQLIEHVLIAVAKQQSITNTTTTVANGHVNNGALDHLLSSSKSMLIIDARSYTAAWANRAKGGGFESAEYYQRTEVQFMGLPNIHNIRYSFQNLRQLLSTSQIDQNTYLQSLQTTQWFLYLSNLMAASVRCAEALLDEGRSVLVHCSDGWDRTTQIISLTKLICDQHYRTMKGFQELIEREWLDFGHKFADRVGLLNSDPNERSPVFLQWLDCVYQLHQQFPCAFEFNELYLAKLVQHVYSSLFGTFLANTTCDAESNLLADKTISIWTYLHPDNAQFRNVIYDERHDECRLRPQVGVQHIYLWRQVYCCGRFERSINIIQDDAAARARNSSTTTMNATEMDRSLTRAHSCDSLSNAEILATSPPSATSILHSHSYSLPRPAPTTTTQHVYDVGAIVEDKQEMNTSTSEISDSIVTGRYYWPAAVHHHHNAPTNGVIIGTKTASSTRISRRRRGFGISRISDAIDVDGLTKVDDPAQERMREIITENDRKVYELQDELRKYKRLWEEQRNGCRRCSENSDCLTTGGSKLSLDEVTLTTTTPFEPRSVESLGSDMSMIMLDEASNEQPTTRWIPDHAVYNCMGCDAQFSTMIRKHHCRSCGKVFCSTCSGNECTVPKERLFEKVRVCNKCYRALELQNNHHQQQHSTVATVTAASSTATSFVPSAMNGQPVMG